MEISLLINTTCVKKLARSFSLFGERFWLFSHQIMSDFNYPSSGERLSNAQRDQLLEQVKQQVALASAQELIQKMSDKCFKKCVYKPGASLDSSEQKCLAMCMDRYMDTWNTISRAYGSRLQREHGAGSSY